MNKLFLFLLGTIFLSYSVPALALETSSQPRSPVSKSSTLEQEARQLYETGQLSEAIPLLQQAIARYRQQGQIPQQAIALRNLALIYQQQGRWQLSERAIAAAKESIFSLPEAEQPNLLAQILEVEGQIALSQAQLEAALDIWQQATNIYRQTGNITGLTQSKVYEAQALRALGFYARAMATLNDLRRQLNDNPNTIAKVKALNSLGDMLRRVGKYRESETVLAESLTIARQLNSTAVEADTLLALGNTIRLDRPAKALEYFQGAIATSPHLETQLQGKLNQFSLLINEAQPERAFTIIPEIEELLEQIPPGSTTIRGRIDLARNLLKSNSDRASDISNYLISALQEARELNLPSLEVAALGTLGTLYERHQRFSEARTLTEQALSITQRINSNDELYQWQWQLGRILKIQGARTEAIAAYTQAVNNLRSLRSDLAAIDSQVQFSFRDSVEPVYRELVALLLHPEATQAELEQAREAIESLQLAELDNFFRDACLDSEPVKIDDLDSEAAIIYTIILKYDIYFSN